MSFTPAEHTAAGHKGTLTTEDGLMFAKPTVQAEIDFYQSLGELPLLDWMPGFYGTLAEGQHETTGKPYMVMENLVHGFVHPSIMDIKLGGVLYDDGASEEKKQRMIAVSESTTSGSLGFRVCGMKCGVEGEVDVVGIEGVEETVATVDGRYVVYDKMYGRQLTAATAGEGIGRFFTTNRSLGEEQRAALVEFFLARLRELRGVLSGLEVRVVAGSVLFIYDNDSERWDKQDEQVEPTLDSDSDAEPSPAIASLRFIDFAHARLVPGEGPDTELLRGLDSIISILATM